MEGGREREKEEGRKEEKNGVGEREGEKNANIINIQLYMHIGIHTFFMLLNFNPRGLHMYIVHVHNVLFKQH